MAEASEVAWRPNPGPQTAFLRCPVTEVLYGGQAGGGKSDALLASATRYVHVGSYRAVIFRRTEKELRQPRGLLERAWAMYAGTGAQPKNGGLTWIWPSGARIDLSGMEHEKDRLKWKSSELQCVLFDELTGFTRLQYVYMFSRLRSTDGIPARIGGATNPGGVGHDWVLERWAPWLYPPGHEDFDGERAEDGEVLWSTWLEEHAQHTIGRRRYPSSIGRTFIRSGLADTPQLEGTGYAERLNELDPLTRAQLKFGDWMARPESGVLFRREWWSAAAGTIVDAAPAQAVARCRYWDFAATEKKPGKSPAATASIVLSRTASEAVYVHHVTQDFALPGTVEQLVRAMAERDHARWGTACPTIIEFDPGQAGVAQVHAYERVLAGLHWRAVRPTGDKVARAKPASAAAERGRIILVRGDWNGGFVDELADFPFGRLKDRVDALSGGYHQLQTGATLVTPTQHRTPTRETARHPGGF